MNIIFDSGSLRSYITDDLHKRLKLPVIWLVIKTFGNVDSKFYDADIVPVQFIIGQKVIVIECLCSPFICSDLTNQSTNFVSKNYPHLKNLFLADASPDGNKKIEVLIGADNYYRFISRNVIQGWGEAGQGGGVVPWSTGCSWISSWLGNKWVFRYWKPFSS